MSALSYCKPFLSLLPMEDIPSAGKCQFTAPSLLLEVIYFAPGARRKNHYE
jgi:hypothetical protein